MSARAPLADLGTHQVQNQVPPLEDYNLFDADPPLSVQGNTFQVGFNPQVASPLGRSFYVRAGYAYR